MRFAYGLVAMLAMTTAPLADEFVVPDEKKAEYQKAAMALVIADQCNKRFDDPEIFQNAKRALTAIAISVDLPDAEMAIEEAANAIANAPQEKQTGFTFATEEACARLSEQLKPGGAE